MLRRDGDSLLVISELALDAKPYNNEFCDITWSECTLRRWLNGEFLRKAFNESEQSLIKTSRLVNNAGPKTEDRVFLLSINEASGLFANNDDRIAKPTAFAAKNGAYTNANNAWWRLRSRFGLTANLLPSSNANNAWWWLRSRGINCCFAALVGTAGSVDIGGRLVNSASVSVRPALRIVL